jgi:GT2 family glycosyltransferase
MTDRVTIAIVAYNDEGSLERCVRSMRSVVASPIIVIDNHSNDATWANATSVASQLQRVTIVRSDENAGYAAGAMLAREMAETPYLAVSNADCVSTGDWVTPIVEFLEANPDVAAASPTVAIAGRSAINAEGLEIHKTGFGFNRHLGRPMAAAAHRPDQVSGLQGTAFVIRLSALDAIGGWYSGGFLYHEDVELSWALRLAGYEISHVPTPPLLHDYELTMSPEKLYLLERNRLCMLSADLETSTKILMAPAFLATEIAVWLYAVRKNRTLASAKYRSYRGFMALRHERASRRSQVRSFRRVSDGELLGAMSWRYPRDQTRVLHQGDATVGRRGNRKMPTS